MSNIGFIGTGTMGSAVAQLVAKNAGDCQLLFANRSINKAEELAQELMGAASDNRSIARECDMIFLGVKPQMLEGVLSEIAPILARRGEGFTLISMAAGVTIKNIQKWAGGDYLVIRMMPNTPLLVGEGVVQYCGNVDSLHLRQFSRLLADAGVVDLVPEEQIDSATAVSGCGPAFCAIMIEALADGGVLAGLPREKALQYAAQTLIGTGQLMLQTETHPALIKEQVCSPAGATIYGVAELEKSGFRSAVVEAVSAAFARSKELGK